MAKQTCQYTITQNNNELQKNRISVQPLTWLRTACLPVTDRYSPSQQRNCAVIMTNGLAKPMGQITITSFRNPHGLQQVSNTSWEETFSSGEALTGIPGSSSLGSVQAGSLEESNVDITQELVGIISTQRKFQANAQVISAGDQQTQTIMNIKR